MKCGYSPIGGIGLQPFCGPFFRCDRVGRLHRRLLGQRHLRGSNDLLTSRLRHAEHLAQVETGERPASLQLLADMVEHRAGLLVDDPGDAGAIEEEVGLLALLGGRPLAFGLRSGRNDRGLRRGIGPLGCSIRVRASAHAGKARHRLQVLLAGRRHDGRRRSPVDPKGVAHHVDVGLEVVAELGGDRIDDLVDVGILFGRRPNRRCWD